MILDIQVVIPAYNESSILLATLEKFEQHNQRPQFNLPIRFNHIVVVQNGTNDGSLELINSHRHHFKSIKLIQLQLEKPNKGEAQKTGAQWLLNNVSPHLNNSTWIYFCDADFPFGFSEFYFLTNSPHLLTSSDLIIGSKAHPESTFQNEQMIRNVYRNILYFLRYSLLNLKVKDTQGSLLVKWSTLKRVLPHVTSSQFLFPIEFILVAIMQKWSWVEIPVRFYPITKRPSKVRPLRDGLALLIQICWLALRYSKSK